MRLFPVCWILHSVCGSLFTLPSGLIRRTSRWSLFIPLPNGFAASINDEPCEDTRSAYKRCWTYRKGKRVAGKLSYPRTPHGGLGKWLRCAPTTLNGAEDDISKRSEHKQEKPSDNNVLGDRGSQNGHDVDDLNSASNTPLPDRRLPAAAEKLPAGCLEDAAEVDLWAMNSNVYQVSVDTAHAIALSSLICSLSEAVQVNWDSGTPADTSYDDESSLLQSERTHATKLFPRVLPWELKSASLRSHFKNLKEKVHERRMYIEFKAPPAVVSQLLQRLLLLLKLYPSHTIQFLTEDVQKSDRIVGLLGVLAGVSAVHSSAIVAPHKSETSGRAHGWSIQRLWTQVRRFPQTISTLGGGSPDSWSGLGEKLTDIENPNKNLPSVSFTCDEVARENSDITPATTTGSTNTQHRPLFETKRLHETASEQPNGKIPSDYLLNYLRQPKTSDYYWQIGLLSMQILLRLAHTDRQYVEFLKHDPLFSAQMHKLKNMRDSGHWWQNDLLDAKNKSLKSDVPPIMTPQISCSLKSTEIPPRNSASKSKSQGESAPKATNTSGETNLKSPGEVNVTEDSEGSQAAAPAKMESEGDLNPLGDLKFPKNTTVSTISPKDISSREGDTGIPEGSPKSANDGEGKKYEVASKEGGNLSDNMKDKIPSFVNQSTKISQAKAKSSSPPAPILERLVAIQARGNNNRPLSLFQNNVLLQTRRKASHYAEELVDLIGDVGKGPLASHDSDVLGGWMNRFPPQIAVTEHLSRRTTSLQHHSLLSEGDLDRKHLSSSTNNQDFQALKTNFMWVPYLCSESHSTSGKTSAFVKTESTASREAFDMALSTMRQLRLAAEKKCKANVSLRAETQQKVSTDKYLADMILHQLDIFNSTKQNTLKNFLLTRSTRPTKIMTVTAKSMGDENMRPSASHHASLEKAKTTFRNTLKGGKHHFEQVVRRYLFNPPYDDSFLSLDLRNPTCPRYYWTKLSSHEATQGSAESPFWCLAAVHLSNGAHIDLNDNCQKNSPYTKMERLVPPHFFEEAVKQLGVKIALESLKLKTFILPEHVSPKIGGTVDSISHRGNAYANLKITKLADLQRKSLKTLVRFADLANGNECIENYLFASILPTREDSSSLDETITKTIPVGNNTETPNNLADSLPPNTFLLDLMRIIEQPFAYYVRHARSGSLRGGYGPLGTKGTNLRFANPLNFRYRLQNRGARGKHGEDMVSCDEQYDEVTMKKLLSLQLLALNTLFRILKSSPYAVQLCQHPFYFPHIFAVLKEIVTFQIELCDNKKFCEIANVAQDDKAEEVTSLRGTMGPASHSKGAFSTQYNAKELSNIVMSMLGCNVWKPKVRGQKGLRILALDGGGSRGVMSIRILKHLCDELGPNVKLCDIFDVICGTSTGGIISVLLGMQQLSVDSTEKIYDALVNHVFQRQFNGENVSMPSVNTDEAASEHEISRRHKNQAVDSQKRPHTVSEPPKNADNSRDPQHSEGVLPTPEALRSRNGNNGRHITNIPTGKANRIKPGWERERRTTDSTAQPINTSANTGRENKEDSQNHEEEDSATMREGIFAKNGKIQTAVNRYGEQADGMSQKKNIFDNAHFSRKPKKQLFGLPITCDSAEGLFRYSGHEPLLKISHKSLAHNGNIILSSGSPTTSPHCKKTPTRENTTNLVDPKSVADLPANYHILPPKQSQTDGSTAQTVNFEAMGIAKKREADVANPHRGLVKENENDPDHTSASNSGNVDMISGGSNEESKIKNNARPILTRHPSSVSFTMQFFATINNSFSALGRLLSRQAYYDESYLEGVLRESLGAKTMIETAAHSSNTKVFCLSTKLSAVPSTLVIWRNYNYGPAYMCSALQKTKGVCPLRLGTLEGSENPLTDTDTPLSSLAAPLRSIPEGSCTILCSEALRATTAAPLFFSPVKRIDDTKTGFVWNEHNDVSQSKKDEDGAVSKNESSYRHKISELNKIYRPPRAVVPKTSTTLGYNKKSCPTRPLSILISKTPKSRIHRDFLVSATEQLLRFSVQRGYASYGDGALMANNPTGVAIAEAQRIFPGVPIECVVSVGTGKFIPTNSLQLPLFPNAWSTAQLSEVGSGSGLGWGLIISQVVASATNTEIVHSILKSLLPEGVYYRFNPTMDFIGIDETRPDKMHLMKQTAAAYFRNSTFNQHRLKALGKILRPDDVWKGQFTTADTEYISRRTLKKPVETESHQKTPATTTLLPSLLQSKEDEPPRLPSLIFQHHMTAD